MADFSVTSSYPEPYCSRIEDLSSACFQESILELWANKGAFDEIAEANIASLTKHSILEKLNSVTGNYSEFYMKEKDFPSMLSGIQRDGFGKIMSASATLMTWMGKMNATRALTEPADDSGTRGELVDLATAQFEKDLAQVLLKYKEVEPENVRIEVSE